MGALRERHVVVFVDDDPGALGALERLLRREPYEILCTARPEEALDWIERRPVSLIVADQRMPGMPGTELLDEVWRRRPSTARVVLTGYPESVVRWPGTGSAVQQTWIKPWDDEGMRRTIRRILRERDLEETELEAE